MKNTITAKDEQERFFMSVSTFLRISGLAEVFFDGIVKACSTDDYWVIKYERNRPYIDVYSIPHVHLYLPEEKELCFLQNVINDNKWLEWQYRPKLSKADAMIFKAQMEILMYGYGYSKKDTARIIGVPLAYISKWANRTGRPAARANSRLNRIVTYKEMTEILPFYNN